MTPLDAFDRGDYRAMALHPQADCRDIVLAGFIEELGELLLVLPQTDPVLQLARGAYPWAEKRAAEAASLLATMPPDAAEHAAATRMRAAIAGTVRHGSGAAAQRPAGTQT